MGQRCFTKVTFVEVGTPEGFVLLTLFIFLLQQEPMITPRDLIKSLPKRDKHKDKLSYITREWGLKILHLTPAEVSNYRRFIISPLLNSSNISFTESYTRKSIVYWAAVNNTGFSYRERLIDNITKEVDYRKKNINSINLLSNIFEAALVDYLFLLSPKEKINYYPLFIKTNKFLLMNKKKGIERTNFNYLFSKVYKDKDPNIYTQHLYNIGILDINNNIITFDSQILNHYLRLSYPFKYLYFKQFIPHKSFIVK